ncbi:hypothetical protein POVCU1_079480 [Plasmodium ovale curtisi]|uniref:Uncharacterized protein n=1 Tax=Plasmodium ovale curtisi TaxID=864141 RepID=A0A1A8XBV5_PLAOA|nr:hypothetical protein POVCU1_079480 [Plasmodium ovale curtisi]
MSYDVHPLLLWKVPIDGCSPTDDTSTFKDVTYGYIQMQVLQLKLLFFRGLDEKLHGCLLKVVSTYMNLHA